MDTTTCPVCSTPVNGLKGLATHFRHRKLDQTHLAYSPPDPWVGKSEPMDYTTCLVCGHKAETLTRHLKASHGITAGQYRDTYPGASIRSMALTAKRSKAISARPIVRGDTKQVLCPGCGDRWAGSKYLAEGIHDFCCPECRNDKEESRWVGKSEPQDYVSCRACGHKTLNLTSHLLSEHPSLVGVYKETYPGAEVLCLGSTLRDKTSIRGVPRSDEFKQKVSKGKMGYLHTPGSKEQMSLSHQALDKCVHFTAEELMRYCLKNGKVKLASASLGLGWGYRVIKRECERLGIPYYCLNSTQIKFLGVLAVILSEEPFEEWTTAHFVNPSSGKKFKFDGYFPKSNIVVEFQGYQHYTFPNRFMMEGRESDHQALLERDAEKRRQVLADGRYKYFEVREDEPWDDPKYLTEKLLALGVTLPGAQTIPG